MAASVLDAVGAGVTRSFFYVEHGQTRFEILVPLPEVAGWLGKAVEDGTILRAGERGDWLKDAAEASVGWVNIQVNGNDCPVSRAEVMLIDSTTASGTPFPLPVDKELPLSGVHLALTWMVSHPAAPERVVVTLKDVFPDLSAFGAETHFGGKSEVLHFTSASPVIEWKNEGRMPPPSGPLAVPPAPELSERHFNVALGLWVMLGLAVQVVLWWKRLRWPGGLLPFLFVWLLGAAVLYPMDVASIKQRSLDLGAGSTLSPEQAVDILHPLLANVYRSLAHPEHSSDGIPGVERLADDLLVPNHSRLRARVDPSNLAVEVESVQMMGTGFSAPVSWTVIGVAHHLGHPDQRVNKYTGRVNVEVVDGAWKLTALDITSHRHM